ncbi:lysylphosphatidylglycerol synthase domain-containing protein [Lonsdalea quercina]|uniref:lysylphosphatidylglycerol synthase domain-containing protein n=1 Tax=Lonsdalea quercina TaxID=71657 RepID=UPI00397609F4
MKVSRRKKKTLLKKSIAALFLIAVVVLLVIFAQNVDWTEVLHAILAYNRQVVYLIAGLVAISYLLYGVYDLLGRAYCRHPLPRLQVLLVSMICYAFNFTLGAWVGGVGMRFRLYSRLGLKSSTITKMFSLSIATNWLGYILLAGGVFAFGPLHMPGNWVIGDVALRLIGYTLLLVIVGYLWSCAFSHRRRLSFRGMKFSLPSLKMAFLQLLVSSLNWLIMGGIIWLLLGQKADFIMVFGVLLIASIACLVANVPAGIGVLEAIFLALLAGRPFTHGEIIAALLAYRALYYIAPLIVALGPYLWLEGRARKLRAKNLQALAEMPEETR